MSDVLHMATYSYGELFEKKNVMQQMLGSSRLFLPWKKLLWQNIDTSKCENIAICCEKLLVIYTFLNMSITELHIPYF